MNLSPTFLSTVLVAVLSVLTFEGTRRILVTRRIRAGLPSYILGLLALGVLVLTEVAIHSGAKTFASIFKDVQLSPHTYALVTDPTGAMPNKPLSERAEFTRHLANLVYYETGKLEKHMSPQGEVVMFSPTQDEIQQRELKLTMKLSSEIRLSHTPEKYFAFLSVILISVFAAFLAARSNSKVGA